MFNLIKSNRMENLVTALCTVLETAPENPMAEEWIGVQSRGMKQWLTTCIAGRFGICANVAFLFPRQILERVLDVMANTAGGGQGSGETAGKPPLSREVLTWAVMDRLTGNTWGSDPSGPARYVREDVSGKKTFQLARTIARVFDDYQVFRHDLLSQWVLSGPSGNPGPFPDQAWQARLWQDLAPGFAPFLSGADALIRDPGRLNRTPDLPGRICLFGVSAMPPRFLDLFSALGRSIEVYLFVLTPSDQFFFDLGSRKQAGKQALKAYTAEAFPSPDTGSPLLRALGRSGREFHGILENFDYHEPFGELFEDPGDRQSGPPSMLEVLQSDILNLVNRGEEAEFPPVPADPNDLSLTLHACHSPMREAQVLKDRILDSLSRDLTLAPHDIIVMMPDIESYAPFLEAVFSQEPRLPYTVSDRRRRSESCTVEAFLKLLKLKAGRLERSKVLDVASCPVVAERFGFTSSDLDGISSALSSARVFWGRDRAHREEVCGMGYEENTWDFGLSRLLMGTVMPEGERELAGTVLPCDGFEGLEAEALGRFAHFASTLFNGLASLAAPRSSGDWVRCLRGLVLAMMAKDGGDVSFILAALDELGREAETAGFLGEISFPAMEAAVTAKLDQSVSHGSFMAGSITLCNLMPMRSIPFRVVCLMGMDERSFPRQVKEPAFNLTARQPRLGDKQVREEDCYLFLESLLSARSEVIITYTGMGISDNAPIPCAGPVAVLKDTVGASFTFRDGHRWIFDHPLHPFSPAYFSPAEFNKDSQTGLFSYAASQCAISRAQEIRKCSDTVQGDSFAAVPPGRYEARHGNIPEGPVDIRSFIRFFCRPVETFFRESLGLGFPVPAEGGTEREAFQVAGLDLYGLGEDFLLRPEAAGDLNRARGILPLGRKGEAEWERVRSLGAPVLEMADALFPAGTPEIREIRISAGGLTFQGEIPDIIGGGRYVKTFGKLTPVRLLTQWLLHLFYCAAVPDPGETRVVGRDPKGAKPAVSLGFSSAAETAETEIARLTDLYRQGLEGILPFACTPCFHLVQQLAETGYAADPPDLEKAVNRARPYWTGGQHLAGEAGDRYTALGFGETDPFANGEAVRASGFLDTGLAVFRPLLEGLVP